MRPGGAVSFTSASAEDKPAPTPGEDHREQPLQANIRHGENHPSPAGTLIGCSSDSITAGIRSDNGHANRRTSGADANTRRGCSIARGE